MLYKNSKISMSEITPQVIEKWKERHTEVFQVNVDDKTGYFRNITTAEIKSRRITKVFCKDEQRTAVNTLKLTWLGGDEEILNDLDYCIPAFNQLQPIFEKKVKAVLPSMRF
ncbi:MAG TPA: hypothetical protein VHE59_10500 [Mucilaginibacter sp.]|nr:hypothetical protein [Mucilaginibacter sp.]